MATRNKRNSYDQPLLSTDTQFELISESHKKSNNMLAVSPDIDPNNNLNLAYNLNPVNPESNNNSMRRQPQFINHSQNPSSNTKYTIADETETEITESHTMTRRSQRSSTSAMYSEYRVPDAFEVDIEQNLINNGIDINHHRQQNLNMNPNMIQPQNTAMVNYNPHNNSNRDLLRNDRISASPSQPQILYNKQASTSHHTHSNSIYTDTGQYDQDNDTLGMSIQ